MDGIGVDEGDLEAEQSAPRPLVDQLRTLGRELVERDADVVDLVGDVVHAGPTLREELADRRLVAERRQQLDPARAHAQRRRLDALVGDRLAVLEPGAEEALVRCDRPVEVGTADALERALEDRGDGALALEAEDGRYTVALKRVVYVKRFNREGRVGFTSG